MTKSRFVVMKHKANKAGLHYDLRFVIPKKKDWDSFAVRKGVPTETGKKVLAIRTTVHSEKEALLVGKIEKGYGAGTLTKWDGGSCEIIKYTDKHMVIDFKGSKIKGVYHMVSTGVIDKKFDKKSYMLFKSKTITETSGMASRVPTGGLKVDTEEGQSEETGSQLSWSLSEGDGMNSRVPPEDTCEVEMSDEEADTQQKEPLDWSISESAKVSKEYAMVCKFKPIKGFFKKKPAGEFLIVACKLKDGYVIIQFFQYFKDDMYIVGIVDGAESPDDSVSEEAFDMLKYSNDVEILEKQVGVKEKVGRSIKYTFSPTSKYLGKSLELMRDSRLGPGYYIGKCKIKKGFEPSIVYKVGSSELNQIKKMRAFTSSRIKNIIGKK